MIYKFNFILKKDFIGIGKTNFDDVWDWKILVSDYHFTNIFGVNKNIFVQGVTFFIKSFFICTY